MEWRITPEKINKLLPNEVYVFGSNESFRNGKGSAKKAMSFGAQYFKGPYCGQTYGISTKDFRIKTLPLDSIKVYVDKFIDFAKDNKELRFLVVPIGCMNAGYKPEQISPLFKDAISIENIFLPKSFWEILAPKKEVKQIKLF